MDSDNNPEFSGYIHAIARRKALLFGRRDSHRGARHTAVGRACRTSTPRRRSSKSTNRRARQSLAETSGGASYADQYVTNLKGIVLTDSNLRKMIKEHDLYPGLADDAGGDAQSRSSGTSASTS